VNEEVPKLGTEAENGPAALKQGRISGFPSHLSTPDSVVGMSESELPAPDVQTAYEQARSDLEKEGMTTFHPTPYAFTNQLIALKATAKERGLTTISGLAHNGPLTAAGVTGCHESMSCLEGLERLYGLSNVRLISGIPSLDVVFEDLEDGI